MHDNLPDLLSLDNIANGAMYELFSEAVKKVAANVADPNTEPTQKRKITITVDVAPYKDRTGAELAIKVETKIAGIRPVDATMYIARRNGEYLAFGKNTKQTEIEFDMHGGAAQQTAAKPQ